MHLIDDINIANLFDEYSMPGHSLPMRCHIIDGNKAKLLENYLTKQLPDCYITKPKLKQSLEKTGLPLTDILKNKFPNHGSVMSGDFGEIVSFFFLMSEINSGAVGVKKWRYKQDRLKPAPHSDIIIFYKEHNDKASISDFIMCAETKQKSTHSSFDPIQCAIEGAEKDRVARLARTLAWLREKAIDEETQSNIKFLERFTHENLDVEYIKTFKAIAIIDRHLLDAEITRTLKIPERNDDFEIIVLGISDLKNLYETVFNRAITETRI
ncbi:MAG: SAVED domain-containing protein [Gammaproteobacteria bacterium]|nr:SAVED domain-containing protein [Gammaproteobacteria bacterium]